MSRLFLIASIFILSGCVSMPSAEKVRTIASAVNLPKTPQEGKAMVYIVRPSPVGFLIKFNVFLDDKKPESEMGYNKSSEYIYFNVSPGHHSILSKAENWASQDIIANAGDIFFLRQEPEIGLIMARNSLTKIDEDYGKYFVSKISLGKIIKTDK